MAVGSMCGCHPVEGTVAQNYTGARLSTLRSVMGNGIASVTVKILHRVFGVSLQFDVSDLEQTLVCHYRILDFFKNCLGVATVKLRDVIAYSAVEHIVTIFQAFSWDSLPFFIDDLEKLWTRKRP